MNELALFAGAGGGILGGKLLGWRTVCAVEWEPYPASVLLARQNDGTLPPFPIWDDVQTFDGNPWRGIVDVVSGGFPCQDISAAGKGEGIDGERSGMWREMARIIHEVRPRFVFVENSSMLTSRGLGRVLGDLATMGFDARWGVLGAADVGANHQRDRIWILAKWRGQLPYAQHNRIRWWEQLQKSLKKEGGIMSNPNKQYGWPQPQQSNDLGGEALHHEPSGIRSKISDSFGFGLETERAELQATGFSGKGEMGNPEGAGLPTRALRQGQEQPWGTSIGTSQWWQAEPNVGRVADGVAARVDRLKAIGNGQVPLCAATAWRILSD